MSLSHFQQLAKSHAATFQFYSYLRFYRQESNFILFVFIKANSSIAVQKIQCSEADKRKNVSSIKTTLNLKRHTSPSAAVLQLVLCSYNHSYEEVSHQISRSYCHNHSSENTGSRYCLYCCTKVCRNFKCLDNFTILLLQFWTILISFWMQHELQNESYMITLLFYICADLSTQTMPNRKQKFKILYVLNYFFFPFYICLCTFTHLKCTSKNADHKNYSLQHFYSPLLHGNRNTNIKQ